MPKYVEVKSAKEYASIFVPDIFFRMAVDRVLDAAPAADVMEVVRCKDCKWFGEGDICNHKHWRDAEGWDKDVDCEGFCYLGERRDK